MTAVRLFGALFVTSMAVVAAQPPTPFGEDTWHHVVYENATMRLLSVNVAPGTMTDTHQHEFDIVLLDVHMPVMDGKETIQRMRAEPRWKDLPVIALTADAMSGDREKYLALGMTDYISKPVDQRELIAKMHQVKGLETLEAGPAARVAQG